MRSSVPIITVLLDEDAITLSWFKHNKTILYLGDQRTFPLVSLEIIGNTLINIRTFVTLIHEFIEHNNLKNSYLSLSVSSAMSWHMLSYEPNNYVWSKEIPADVVSNNVMLEYEPGLQYLFGVTRPLIFKYQLIALMVSCKALILTTHMRALIQSVVVQKGRIQELFNPDLELMKSNIANYLIINNSFPVISSKDYTKNEQWYISLGLYYMSKEL